MFSGLAEIIYVSIPICISETGLRLDARVVHQLHKTHADQERYSYGWGTLIVAGGGAYYFAKKSINADRAAKAEADRQKRQAQYELENAHFSTHRAPNSNYSSPPTQQSNTNHAVGLNTPAPRGNLPGALDKRGEMTKDERKDEVRHRAQEAAIGPSGEASQDPAPTRHEPEDEAQKMKEKSKYEASVVYRSRKGDRFS
jgi:hypothetical protein